MVIESNTDIHMLLHVSKKSYPKENDNACPQKQTSRFVYVMLARKRQR